jgi:UPF0755 protein
LPKWVKSVIGCGLLLSVGITGTLGYLWRIPYKNFSEDEKFLLIPRGTSSLEISHQLEKEGIVRHWALFLGYVKICKISRPLQAGEYRFEKPLSICQVADRLIHGLVYYREVTIPEGYSVFEIADLLVQKKLAAPESFRAAAGDARLIANLVPEARNLEGFLFPDTYRFTRGVSAEEMVQQMVNRFRQMYSSFFRSEVEQSSMSLNQVITLASLIEKETGVEDERPLVSSVFHNRMKLHIPLQCDPTVIYAAKLRGTFRQEILPTDLDTPSPYNTYLHPGLPPGPIANPGLSSVEAALKPASSNYLYFVSTNQGGHVFSTTLEQHSRAVAVYRRDLKKTVHRKQGRS